MNGEKAVEDFKKAVELNPHFILSNVQCCYAQYLHAKQTSNELDSEKFLKKLKGFVIKYPDNAESYTLYAQVNQSLHYIYLHIMNILIFVNFSIKGIVRKRSV